MGGLLTLLFGGFGLYSAYQQYQLRQMSSDQPQTLTCRELIDKGPGTNVYVVVTDFKFLGEQIVVQNRGRFVKTEPWQKAWVPVLAVGGDGQPDKTAVVILDTDSIITRGQLQALEKTGKIRGLVVNGVAALGDKEAKLLREAYPYLDMDKCYSIRQEATGESTGTGLMVAGVGGALLVLVTLILWTIAGFLLRALKRQVRAEMKSE